MPTDDPLRPSLSGAIQAAHAINENAIRVLMKKFDRGPHLAVSAAEITIAGLVALVITAGYVGIAALHGAIGASRNDDWVYFRSAYHFAVDGVFIPGTSVAMLVGHDILAWPVIQFFGPKIVPLQIMVAVLGAVGLWAAYLLIRSVLSPGWSTFAVGCLVIGPVYGSLDASFMTDVPAFAFQMLTLLAGLLALRKRDLVIGWYAASMLAGIAAFSIREYAVAAPLAVSAAALIKVQAKWPRLCGKVAGLNILWLASVTALYIWRSRLAGSGALRSELAPNSPTMASTIASLLRAAFTLALFVAPLVPLISIPRLARSLKMSKRTAIVLGLGVCMSWATLTWSGEHVVLLGNYLMQSGSYSTTIPGTPPVVIPSGLWKVLEVLGLASLLVLGFLGLVRAGEVIRYRNTKSRSAVPPDPGRTLMLLFCSMAIGVVSAVPLITSAQPLDRYLFPVVPFVVALSIRVALDHRLVIHQKATVATLALVGYAAFGIGAVDASATFDGAKWQLAQSVVARGYEADSIDGGYEWFGYHQPGPIAPRARVPGTDFWVSLFHQRPVCVTSRFEGPSPTSPPNTKATLISSVSLRSLVGVEYHLIAVSGPQSCQARR